MKKLLKSMRERRWNAWLKPHLIPGLVRELDALRRENKALRRWVHARHVPSMRSVPVDPLKVLMGMGKRFAFLSIITFSGDASAQPILRTFYTTNTTPVVTAFVSAGGTNSRQFGTASLTNLSGNPNVATNILGSGSVTVSSNNAGTWTISSAAITDAGGTNSRQGGSLVLTNLSNTGAITNLNDTQFVDESTIATIKAGAFLTNFNGFLPGTNHSNWRVEGDLVVTAGDTFTENIFPSLDDNYLIGSASSALNSIFAKSGGLNLVESIGSDAISILAPALASSYSFTLPNAQGADGTTITNNGSGALGWWNATAVIAQKQFGGANLTNWSNIPTGAMANVVSTDFLTNWANAISNLTQTKTALTTNANQFGASVQLTIKDGALLTNVTLRGTTTILGPQTNSDMVNIAGGVTNWNQSEFKGTLHASSNLLVEAGDNVLSNAWVGGTYWWSTASWTNHTATANSTNLATNAIAGNVLTNNGDAVHIQWRIKMANLLANTNQFQIVYGSETVLDTGLLPSSNSVCTADLWITRTGNTSQNAEGRFEWGPGSGAPYAYTNTNVELVQTNGISTIFQLRHQARRVGAATNNWTRAWFDPAVR